MVLAVSRKSLGMQPMGASLIPSTSKKCWHFARSSKQLSMDVKMCLHSAENLREQHTARDMVIPCLMYVLDRIILHGKLLLHPRSRTRIGWHLQRGNPRGQVRGFLVKSFNELVQIGFGLKACV